MVLLNKQRMWSMPHTEVVWFHVSTDLRLLENLKCPIYERTSFAVIVIELFRYYIRPIRSWERGPYNLQQCKYSKLIRYLGRDKIQTSTGTMTETEFENKIYNKLNFKINSELKIEIVLYTGTNKVGYKLKTQS